MPRASKAVDAARKPAARAVAAGKDASKPKAKAAVKAAAKPAKGPAPSATKAVKPREPAKAAKAAKEAKGSKQAKAAKAAEEAKAAKAAKAAKTVKGAAPAKAAKAPKPARAGKQRQGAKAAGADKFLGEQRALLEEERVAYAAQAADLKAEADQIAQEMEPGDIQFDDESGEGGTAAVDRERDLALSAQARIEVDEIDHALAKLASGSYGTCESCGQPIPHARLRAIPHARLCVACKSGGLSRR